MATARDKLVADWRDRLHAAEALLAESPRYVWLAQMRIRLYRFLLSCYGKQPWRTNPAADPAADVIFDAPDAALLHGKPAKAAGKIQAVLKSLAGAQTGDVEAGPWANGLAPESWVIVATRAGNVHPARLQQLLHWFGISSQLRIYGTDEAVEVEAVNRARAREIVNKYHWWLRGTDGHSGTMALPVAEFLLYVMVLGPQIAFLLIGVLGLAVTWLAGHEVNMAAFWPDYGRVWVASALAGAVVFLPLAWTLLIARRRRPKVRAFDQNKPTVAATADVRPS